MNGGILRSPDPHQEWPEASLVLVVTDGAGYRRALEQTAAALVARNDGGIIITANRPAALLRHQLAEAGVPLDDVSFIDCISCVTGAAPADADGIVMVESPTLLEKAALRGERMLRAVQGKRRFVLLDSLSTFAMYNGAAAVTEFTHGLTTRLRILDAEGAFLLVENQAEDGLRDAVRPLCDRLVRL